MLADSIPLLLGVAGTVAYLRLWQTCLRSRGPTVPGRDRQRRRLVQILFFLVLTPYVLVLFWLMERARAWLGGIHLAPSGA